MEKVFDFKFRFHEGERAKLEREEFLGRFNIGITDMHKECYRKDNSSSDNDLYPVRLTDILNILDRFKAINTIVFTSRTEAVGAFGLFNTYLYLVGLEMVKTERLNDGLLKGEFVHKMKTYRIWVPYSPSQRSQISKTLGLKGLAKMYKKCFTI